jgi:hypothetical protein
MNSARACLLVLLAFSITIGCTSSMPGGNSNAGSSGPPPAGSSAVSITSIKPDSASAGSGDFVVTIVGTGFPATPAGFKDHPAVLWGTQGNGNGTYLQVANDQSDATHVTATVPASLVQSSGKFNVTVQIWFKADDMPKATSNTLTFSVD